MAQSIGGRKMKNVIAITAILALIGGPALAQMNDAPAAPQTSSGGMKKSNSMKKSNAQKKNMGAEDDKTKNSMSK
jgi:uncharacterized protein YdeI (BOF family)